MQDPKRQLRAYLEKLIRRYQNVQSLQEQLHKIGLWKSRPNTTAIDLGYYFFALVSYSFARTITVELCALLSSREQRSLVDWLEKAHKHASSLGPEQYHVERDTYELIDPEEYSQIINGHLAKINQRKGVIDRLKTHRDKAIAHLDKTYFENPDKLYLDHPLHDSDVLDLLDLVKDVLTTHYLYLFKADADLGVQSVTDVQTVLQYVEAFARVRADPGLLKTRFRPADYLED